MPACQTALTVPNLARKFDLRGLSGRRRCCDERPGRIRRVQPAPGRQRWLWRPERRSADDTFGLARSAPWQRCLLSVRSCVFAWRRANPLEGAREVGGARTRHARSEHALVRDGGKSTDDSVRFTVTTRLRSGFARRKRCHFVT